MAKRWGASDAVSQANLNSAFAFDAVVDGGGSTSGATYDTIDAAIDAGHKSIFVKEGSYVGFTADVAGLHIVGENQTRWNGTAFEAYGVRITSTIEITTPAVVLENIAVDTASGHGWTTHTLTEKGTHQLA